MHYDSPVIERGAWTFWRGGLRHALELAHHPDPLVEASNWVALTLEWGGAGRGRTYPGAILAGCRVSR